MKTHIFLIDDSIEEMRLFMGALNEVGEDYKCTYASSGSHALKMLQYLRPQKIFIKYNMPEMNGVEITQEVRKNKDLEHVPVFLFFTQQDNYSPEMTLALNATHCIEKPYSKIDMVSLLKSVFELNAIASSASV